MTKPRKIKPRDLEGAWAVVTGASSGIGLEFSRYLASLGCGVVMVSNQGARLEKEAAEVTRKYGVRSLALDLDLSLRDAAGALLAFLDEHCVKPLLLVNNAGIFDLKTLSQLTPERIDLYTDLHMRTVTQLTRSVAERMALEGRGYILNMSSMSCWMPMPGIAMYSATKAYIRALSRAAGCEYRPRGVGVTVACPGGIATDLFGLSPKWMRFAVGLHAVALPEKFVRRAVRRTLRCRAQYINGLGNRLAIVAVSVLPRPARVWWVTKLMPRLQS